MFRERAGQRRVSEVDVNQVAGEDVLVNVAAVDTDDLAEHDIRIELVGRGDKPSQGVSPQPVVGADEEDVPAGREVEPTVARPRGSARVGLMDDCEGARMAPGVPV